MSRPAAGNSDGQFTQGAPLRRGERADAARYAFEPVPIQPTQSAQGLLESWALDYDRLVRLQLTESLRLPAHRGLALSTHGFDNLGSGCQCFRRHRCPTLADDLIDRAR